MKLRNDQTRAEERERISRAVGGLTRQLDGKWGFGDLPFKVELSAARRDRLLSAARGYKSRGLPISGALLLLSSCDPDAGEVARSREYADQYELIEARHEVAALATHHSTWAYEFPKNQYQRFSSAGLNGAQLAFIRQAPQAGDVDMSQLQKMLSRHRFHGDQRSLQQIKAAYIALLLLAQAPETSKLSPSWLRASLNVQIINKVFRLQLNHFAPGLSFNGGLKGAKMGIFGVRFDLPDSTLSKGQALTTAERKQLVARGAHRVSSTWIHLNASHVEELATFADVTSGEQTGLL